MAPPPSFWIIILFVWHTGLTYAQSLSTCKVDVSPLQAAITPDEQDIQPQTWVWLNYQYVKRLDNGTFARQPQECQYYEYVRPASQKELKQQTVWGNPEEFIAPDGHIYLKVNVAPEVHFFRAQTAFNGNYTPKWEARNWFYHWVLRLLTFVRMQRIALR